MGPSVGVAIALLAAVQAREQFAKAVLLIPSPYYLNHPGYHSGFERADLLTVLDTGFSLQRDTVGVPLLALWPAGASPAGTSPAGTK